MFFTGNFLVARSAFVSLKIAEMVLERSMIFSGVVGTPDLCNQRSLYETQYGTQFLTSWTSDPANVSRNDKPAVTQAF
jgi:hypothetical protein